MLTCYFGFMKKIILTKGYEATIDDEDFEKVSKLKWHVKITTACGKTTPYAHTSGISLHRFLMDCPKKMRVDHINHDTMDNRRANLRICTPSQNSSNRVKNIARGTSMYKGVFYSERLKKWQATITAKRKRYNLGWFKTELEAALAYNAGAVKYHGDFAYLNECK